MTTFLSSTTTPPTASPPTSPSRPPLCIVPTANFMLNLKALMVARQITIRLRAVAAMATTTRGSPSTSSPPNITSIMLFVVCGLVPVLSSAPIQSELHLLELQKRHYLVCRQWRLVARGAGI
mmetsp:Transcript_35/g.67  ORF Transcript_35/g.67 Transcript_35/m.67 type:complete len:122 (+) Transcript_35:350-715(+)